VTLADQLLVVRVLARVARPDVGEHRELVARVVRVRDTLRSVDADVEGLAALAAWV
jgi:hypothetical protein